MKKAVVLVVAVLVFLLISISEARSLPLVYDEYGQPHSYTSVMYPNTLIQRERANREGVWKQLRREKDRIIEDRLDYYKHLASLDYDRNRRLYSADGPFGTPIGGVCNKWGRDRYGNFVDCDTKLYYPKSFRQLYLEKQKRNAYLMGFFWYRYY